MKGTIQVYADGVLQIICINCAEKYTEQEPFGGVMVDWCCPCCRKTQSRGDYSNVFMQRPYSSYLDNC